MSLSRTQFFFNKNSSVLNTVIKSNIRNFKLNCGACSITRSKTAQNIKNSSILRYWDSNKTNKPNGSSNIKATDQIKLNSFSRIDKRNYSTDAQIPIDSLNETKDTSKQQTQTNSKQEETNKETIISKKYVGYWLIGTSTLIFGIVVIGGLTRLTESGLSITEWKPVTGAIPPLNEQEWELEFTKYQESPEFKLLNSHITLEEFKFIFFMEWMHRLWGRSIGLIFVLPTLYFVKTRKVTRIDSFKLLGLCCLLGFQGFIGWWMVQSGLDEDQLKERNSKPTVSQYRLTTHLGIAFSLYLGMLSMGFRIIKEAKWANNPTATANLISMLDNSGLTKLRKYSRLLLGLTFLTAMSGGLVAGLDAGLIYNTFPHMGDDYLPSKNELFDPVFSRTNSDLIWRNLLENPTTVQLTHRILATTTFFSVLALHLYSSRIKTLVPKRTMRLVHATMGFASLQVALGISTLIYLVPIPLAALHQAGALALLTSVLALCASLRHPGTAIRVIIKKLTNNTAKTTKV